MPNQLSWYDVQEGDWIEVESCEEEAEIRSGRIESILKGKAKDDDGRYGFTFKDGMVHHFNNWRLRQHKP